MHFLNLPLHVGGTEWLLLHPSSQEKWKGAGLEEKKRNQEVSRKDNDHKDESGILSFLSRVQILSLV